MRRLAALMLVVPVMLATAAPPWSGSGDDAPSVLDPSVPLSYVGNDGSVSVGINGEGHTEGQLLGVFARSNTRAVVGQLWWDRSGAGGVQGDYNWLWGGSALEAREHPDQATVARLSFAIDQNGEHDRKSTLGFGIERRAFTLEGYVAAGISSARNSGSTLATSATTLNGSDAIGSYTEIETTAVQTLFQSKPYGTEFGLQLGRTLQPFGTRVHVGASTQDGNGARANTWSVGVDSPLGTRGWGVSALAEHVNRTGSLDAGKDDRLSVFVRYEFGKTGSFQPTRQLEDPAWITQSLAQPSTAHSRNVESYQQRRSQTTTVTRGPKQYSNHFPLAQADSATTVEGQSVSINVLANDSDPDGDRLGISTVTQPAHGSAAIAGGQVTYTPAAGYSGSDSFRYSASDGRGGSATAQVSVTVGARPDQPPLARDDNANVAFGQSASIDVLANDTDADGDTLAIVAVGIPLHGSATLSGQAIVYRAAPGYSGSDRFTYTISDGRGGSASASVVISVSARPNRVPIARDDAAATAFGQAVTIDALANDTDPDGDALSIVATTAPAHGSVVIAAHALRYTPVAGYAGTDAFRYTISDGRGGSASATVAITIAAQPDRAPIAADDSATTLSGQSLTIAVLANDTDPDGDPLTLASVTAPRVGSATISGNQVVYTPNPAAVGTDQFGYTISDGRGGTASAVVTVVVTAPPDRPPVAVDDTATTVAGQAVTIAVLANDSDPDGDALTIVAITAPAVGTAAIVGNSVVYTPSVNGAIGTDRFGYTISDGRGGSASAVVTVVVTAPPNRPPVAVDDTATTGVSQAVSIAVLANDSDPDGDPLTVSAVTAPADGTATITGATVQYAPRRGFAGIDRFAYTISDGRGGSATAFVTVTVVAGIPRMEGTR